MYYDRSWYVSRFDYEYLISFCGKRDAKMYSKKKKSNIILSNNFLCGSQLQTTQK